MCRAWRYTCGNTVHKLRNERGEKGAHDRWEQGWFGAVECRVVQCSGSHIPAFGSILRHMRWPTCLICQI